MIAQDQVLNIKHFNDYYLMLNSSSAYCLSVLACIHGINKEPGQDQNYMWMTPRDVQNCIVYSCNIKNLTTKHSLYLTFTLQLAATDMDQFIESHPGQKSFNILLKLYRVNRRPGRRFDGKINIAGYGGNL